jgi:hypothetical protein
LIRDEIHVLDVAAILAVAESARFLDQLLKAQRRALLHVGIIAIEHRHRDGAHMSSTADTMEVMSKMTDRFPQE